MMHIFEKVSLIFKKLHRHDRILVVVSGICLIIGLVWGTLSIVNHFTIPIPMHGGSIKYGA
jgi:hypothetical protein